MDCRVMGGERFEKGKCWKDTMSRDGRGGQANRGRIVTHRACQKASRLGRGGLLKRVMGDEERFRRCWPDGDEKSREN
jgi:hypothetical protein